MCDIAAQICETRPDDTVQSHREEKYTTETEVDGRYIPQIIRISEPVL